MSSRYVVFFQLSYASFAEAFADAPDTIAAHRARAAEFHARGTLITAGAFVDKSPEPLTTMAVFTTHEAAEEFASGDPFVPKGRVTRWFIREWADMLAPR
jgi:uncharacterized protein